MNELKIGTDFSGVGAPEQAIKNLGYPYKSIFACDVDKYARTTFLANHEVETMYEDITTRDHSKVPQLSLYVAGFPCQAFSLAGLRLGFEDVRGTLFFNTAEFIKINQPDVFILENVKGLLSHDKGRTFQTILDLLSNGGGTINGQMSLDMFEDGLGYHVYWQVLNSKEHGVAQNRERVFIVGFRESRDFQFPKPEPLTKALRDYLEEDVDPKYFLSEKMIKGFLSHNKRHIEEKNQTGFNWKPKDGSDIANCLRANTPDCATDTMVKVGYINQDTQSGRVFSEDGVSPYIGAGSQGYSQGYVQTNKVKQINKSKESGDQQPYQQNRVYDPEGLSPAVLSNLGGERSHNIPSGHSIRRLTPRECFRLQDFPDTFDISKVSDTQAYKQAGNSMTVRVVEKIIKNIYG